MQVWDASHDQSIQFDWRAEAIRYNAPLRTVATMCENSNLSRALLLRLEELGAESSLLSATSVEGIANGIDDPEGLNLSTWPVISIKSSPAASNPSNAGKQIATRLLIGADGINSPVRTFAGINTYGWDYDRHGVVATLKLKSTSADEFSPSDAPDFDSALEDFLSDDEPKSSTEPSPSASSENITSSNRATAYQRFLPTLGGPIAILPLPDNHASLVWSTTPQIAATLKAMSPAAFVATVNAALTLDAVDIEYMLSLPSSSSTNSDPENSNSQHEKELLWRHQHTSPPPTSRPPPTIVGVQPNTIQSFPLRLRNSSSYISPRVALSGDAAHTIHPLAGQGLNLGLADAESLARHVRVAVEHGMDIGDVAGLQGYARERYIKAVEMGSAVDLLNGVYQMGANGMGSGGGAGLLGTLAGTARGLGMWVVGRVPGVMEGVMRRAG